MLGGRVAEDAHCNYDRVQGSESKVPPDKRMAFKQKSWMVIIFRHPAKNIITIFRIIVLNKPINVTCDTCVTVISDKDTKEYIINSKINN